MVRVNEAQGLIHPTIATRRVPTDQGIQGNQGNFENFSQLGKSEKTGFSVQIREKFQIRELYFKTVFKPFILRKYLFTVHNEVGARLYFHRRLSFC